MSHYSHLLHYSIVVGYFFIALQFWWAMRSVQHSHRAKFSLFAMLTIFILCGVTRVLLDLGVHTLVAEILHAILAFFTWAYVLTGQSSSIVAGLRDAVDDLVDDEITGKKA